MINIDIIRVWTLPTAVLWDIYDVLVNIELS